jgi:hypothetical protein
MRHKTGHDLFEKLDACSMCLCCFSQDLSKALRCLGPVIQSVAALPLVFVSISVLRDHRNPLEKDLCPGFLSEVKRKEAPGNVQSLSRN